MITMMAVTTMSDVVMTKRLPCNLGEIAPRNNCWRLVVDPDLVFHPIGDNCGGIAVTIVMVLVSMIVLMLNC